MKLSAVRTNEGRLFQTVEAQRENRRAAMFVDEDCVDSRSDVDDLRTRGLGGTTGSASDSRSEGRGFDSH